MSIAQKLQDILDCKDAIKTSINNKGGSITAATPLADYATAIDNLPSGSDEDLKKIIEGTATTLTIPNGATMIRNYAFYNLSTLLNVEIPNTVTSIGTHAFQSTGLTTLDIPNSVITLGEQFAAFCGELLSINFGNSVQTIGVQALYNDFKLTQLVFPDSLKEIKARATHGCSRVVYLEYGTGIETIANDAGAKNIGCIIVCKALTPPTLGTGFCPNNFAGKIYVPDASVNDYKTASNWSAWASFIYPLSEYTP